MSQAGTEALHRFEQKMHAEGSDGFADGPRPWENWDESGNQANNHVWEGSASRVPSKGRKQHSLFHRLLSLLAFVALSALLVGIVGVVYTHMTTPTVASNGVQPLPITTRERTAVSARDMPSPVQVTAVTGKDTTAGPAAVAEHSTDPQEPATADSDAPLQLAAVEAPPTDTAAIADAVDTPAESLDNTTGTAAMTPEDTAPEPTASMPAAAAVTNNIDSVSIETVVTESSVTTTVYTRQPQREAEVVAAIETTPPPFAHGVEATTLADAESVDAEATAGDAVPPPATTADAAAGADENASAAATADSEPAADETPVTVTDSPADPGDEPVTAAAVTAPESNTVVATTKPEATIEANEPLTTAAVETTVTAAAPVDTPPETAASPPKEPIMPVAYRGDWVINLASYSWKSTANRKRTEFQDQGVDAEVFRVMIKDKPMYRVRVTGYPSSRAARAAVKPIEQVLGFEGAWVGKR